MSRMRLIGIVLCCLLMLPSFAAKDKKTRKEPLFGKAQASYQITSDALKGATFYLVSGHGGPDPGCIGKYQGSKSAFYHSRCERRHPEYGYSEKQ